MHLGVGTNRRQMSMILDVPLFQAGFEVVAIDMPGYGCTEVNKTGGPHYYKDWVDIADDFVNLELETHDRPIVLYGLVEGCCVRSVSTKAAPRPPAAPAVRIASI